MGSIRSRRTAIALFPIIVAVASPAPAADQLFHAWWNVKAQGNEITTGTGKSAQYSAIGFPMGHQCNRNQPGCPFESTPTDGSGHFDPLGGSLPYALYCAPWYDFAGMGTTARPAKGMTVQSTGPNRRLIPPLYRNPALFTPSGEPNHGFCHATSTGYTPDGKGKVQAGRPITAKFAPASETDSGGFQFSAAASGSGPGIRATGIVGEFRLWTPYIYTYTYATLRNDQGGFSPAGGPGSIDIRHKQAGKQGARIQITAGAAKFGGTMRMLGALTTKRCYFRNGGCSLGSPNWLYDGIGASAPTQGGVVTKGFQTTTTFYYRHSALNQYSTVVVEGSRFPWTTGSVTVTALGPGQYKTVHYHHGYDNRTLTPNGLLRTGTIQLVSPVMTRWLRVFQNYETGGIAILRLQFVPEPRGIAMFAAGIGLLAVAYRMRTRSR